jgi:glycosyl transferase family 25
MTTPSDYKIYLINLRRSESRLATMTKKFDELGLSFQRIDAVDGKARGPEANALFAAQRPRANGWLPGAIGCFMSHFNAWEAIAKADSEFGVVFEDDVHIASALPELLNHVGNYLDRMDVLRLEATKHQVRLDHNDVVNIGETKLIKVTSETWCTGAYVMPKRVAKLLLLDPLYTHSPVDFFLFDKGTSVVARRNRVFQTVPAVCVQAKFDPEQRQSKSILISNIEHNSGDGKIRHIFRKVGWRVNGLRNFIKGYRRIPLSDDIARL